MIGTLSITKLRVLREVAARGTITAAAEALYLSPAAVSHHLATLEAEVGVALFERTPRSIRLNFAGQRLLGHAERVLADCEAALADLASLEGAVTGTVRVSVFQTAAQSFALPAIALLGARYPELAVHVSELEPVSALPALKSDRIDIALSQEWDFVPVAQDPGITRHMILEEPIVALLPRTHPLAGGPVRMRDLIGEKWCIAKETAQSRQAVERVAQASGFELDIVFESNYFRAIGSAVEAGLGVGIASVLTDLRGLDIATVPLTEPAMKRRIFAATRKGSESTPALAAVVEVMREVAAQLGV